jgi:predicted HicB family RNase H-like nuclease
MTTSSGYPSQICVRVDAALRRRLEAAAERDRRSISNWARLLIADRLADLERQSEREAGR